MPTNPIDLTTVQRVKDWIGSFNPANISEDANIQSCITSASNYWLYKIGRSSADQGIPEKSPLVEVVDYSEFYDGSGGNRQFVRVTPIVSVTAIQVNGIGIPASTNNIVPGFVIDQSRKSIAIVGCGGFFGGFGNFLGRGTYGVPGTTRLMQGGWGFIEGVQNVFIQYSAGFAVTPADIEDMCRQMVALNYKRKAWIDQKSQAMANGAGTITFRDWLFPPLCIDVMNAYTRRAPVY